MFKVCNVANGKCVECFHNDFGPESPDRIIDLSFKAFNLIADVNRGLTLVSVQMI